MTLQILALSLANLSRFLAESYNSGVIIAEGGLQSFRIRIQRLVFHIRGQLLRIFMKIVESLSKYVENLLANFRALANLSLSPAGAMLGLQEGQTLRSPKPVLQFLDAT